MIMSFHKIAKLTVQWILLHCGYVQLRDVILRILGKVPITILTYHLIGMNKHPNNVTPSTFRQQLEYLCKRYKVADIGDGVKVLCSGKRNSRLLCCITFDDGYESNMQFAVPILKEFCSSAIFFVASACITQHRPFPDDERRGLLDFLPFTWEQVITLQKQHFCIGSHTSTHTNCGEEKNLYEIGQSKDEIEKSSTAGWNILHFRTDVQIQFTQLLHLFLKNRVIQRGLVVSAELIILINQTFFSL